MGQQKTIVIITTNPQTAAAAKQIYEADALNESFRARNIYLSISDFGTYSNIIIEPLDHREPIDAAGIFFLGLYINPEP